MTRRVQVPFIVIYLLLGAVGLMAVGILTYAISDHAAHAASDAVESRANAAASKIQAANAAGCDRNQVLRGYVLLRAAETIGSKSPASGLARNYFQIVNCNETYITNVKAGNAGDVTYLSRPLQACFLVLLSKKAFGQYAEDVTTSPSRLHQDYNCT